MSVLGTITGIGPLVDAISNRKEINQFYGQDSPARKSAEANVGCAWIFIAARVLTAAMIVGYFTLH